MRIEFLLLFKWKTCVGLNSFQLKQSFYISHNNKESQKWPTVSTDPTLAKIAQAHLKTPAQVKQHNQTVGY